MAIHGCALRRLSAFGGLTGAMMLAASGSAWAGTVTVLPEPTSLALLGAGVAGLVGVYRMRGRK